jgi:hypothetical protein
MQRHIIVGKVCGKEWGEVYAGTNETGYPGASHHVMIRGIEGAAIFRNREMEY